MFIRNTLKNGKETLQTEGQALRCQKSPNKSKAEITILMPQGLERKVRGTKRNKEEHCVIIKDSLWQRSAGHKPSCPVETQHLSV